MVMRATGPEQGGGMVGWICGMCPPMTLCSGRGVTMSHVGAGGLQAWAGGESSCSRTGRTQGDRGEVWPIMGDPFWSRPGLPAPSPLCFLPTPQPTVPAACGAAPLHPMHVTLCNWSDAAPRGRPLSPPAPHPDLLL